MWNLGRTAIIVLRDGTTTFRGKIAWSWFWGQWCLRDVELLDGEEQAQDVVGKTLIPAASVLFVQVMG